MERGFSLVSTRYPPLFFVLSHINPVYTFRIIYLSLILIHSSLHCLDRPGGLLSLSFPTKILYILLFSPFGPLALVTSFFLIWSPEWYFVRSSNDQPDAVFCSPAASSPPYAQISPSAPHSRTPSACVLPLMWETKFHTHTKQRKSI
jgi:hypothetical protein